MTLETVALSLIKADTVGDSQVQRCKENVNETENKKRLLCYKYIKRTMNQNALLLSLIGGILTLGGVSYYLYKSQQNQETGLTADQEKRLWEQTNYRFGGTKRRYRRGKNNKRSRKH